MAAQVDAACRASGFRVVPPAGEGPALRRSAAFFLDGNYDAVVSCLPGCVAEGQSPQYAPVTAGDHLLAKLLGPRTLTATEGVGDDDDRIAALR